MCPVPSDIETSRWHLARTELRGGFFFMSVLFLCRLPTQCPTSVWCFDISFLSIAHKVYTVLRAMPQCADAKNTGHEDRTCKTLHQLTNASTNRAPIPRATWQNIGTIDPVGDRLHTTRELWSKGATKVQKSGRCFWHISMHIWVKFMQEVDKVPTFVTCSS